MIKTRNLLFEISLTKKLRKLILITRNTSIEIPHNKTNIIFIVMIILLSTSIDVVKTESKPEKTRANITNVTIIETNKLINSDGICSILSTESLIQGNGVQI